MHCEKVNEFRVNEFLCWYFNSFAGSCRRFAKRNQCLQLCALLSAGRYLPATLDDAASTAECSLWLAALLGAGQAAMNCGPGYCATCWVGAWSAL
jgi:hypothetical protein